MADAEENGFLLSFSLLNSRKSAGFLKIAETAPVHMANGCG
jgi:hypothetical protein